MNACKYCAAKNRQSSYSAWHQTENKIDEWCIPNKIDLAIVVPCHNLEPYIQPLLASLNVQQFNYNVQIVFVVDSCTDRTRSIIKDNIDTNKYKVDIIDTKVGSCGLSRNIGKKYATGNYIWFVDGDDFLLGYHAIQICLDILYSGNLNILRLNFHSNQEDLAKLGRIPGTGVATADLDNTVWQYIYKSELISDIEFDAGIGEDDRFNSTVFTRVDKSSMLITYDAMYYYNFLRPGSAMQLEVETNGWACDSGGNRYITKA